jgi:hypothetical protein
MQDAVLAFSTKKFFCALFQSHSRPLKSDTTIAFGILLTQSNKMLDLHYLANILQPWGKMKCS